MSLSKLAIKMHACCVSGSVCKHKLAEHLGKAHGNRVGISGRDGVRLPDVCSVERRPGQAQGESSATRLGEEVFSWHRRKQPISESAKNEEAGWSQPSALHFL